MADARLRQYSWPLIEPHRDYIVEPLEAGVTKATIHQRLRDEKGLDASVASVKRWIAALVPEPKTRTLTAGVARLLASGVTPERILLLTFTRRAAAAMTSRAAALCGDPAW